MSYNNKIVMAICFSHIVSEYLCTFLESWGHQNPAFE